MADSVSSLSYFERILSQSELALALSFKIQSSNIKCDIYMISVQAYLKSNCVHEGLVLVLVLKSTRPRPVPSRPRPRPRPEFSRPRPRPEPSRPRSRYELSKPRPKPRPRPQNRVSRRSRDQDMSRNLTSLMQPESVLLVSESSFHFTISLHCT